MIWRWIIRGMVVAVLVVCVAAWWVSYRWDLSVSYASKTSWYSLGVGWGRLYLHTGRSYFGGGWSMERGPASEWDFWSAGEKGVQMFGFDYRRYGNNSETSFPLSVLPILVLLGVLILALWRQWRRLYKGKGFPVEVTAKEREDTKDAWNLDHRVGGRNAKHEGS